MSPLQVIAHPAPRVLVRLAGALHVGQRRYLRNRNIPPRIISTDTLFAVDGDHDDVDALALFRGCERACDFVPRRRAFRVRPHGRGVRDNIYLACRPAELPRRAATPIRGPEAVAPDRLRESANAGEPVIIEQEDR